MHRVDDLVFANYFMDRFESAYLVNLETRAFRVFKRSERLARDYPETDDYLSSVKEYCEREIQADDREDFMEFVRPENLRMLMRQKVTASHSYRVVPEDGDRTYQLRVVRGADENNVALAFSDVTDEVRRERERQQAIDAERGASRRNEAMHRILKSAPWSVKFDADRNITSYELSPELFKVFRNHFESVEQWTELLHPDDAEQAVQASSATLRDLTGQTMLDVEYRIRAGNGEYHWVRSAGRIILDPSGGGEMYGMCIDIDERVKRREREQRLLEDARAMERVNAAKSRFFSMVSHDIRTPLNAIIGYAELLKLGIVDEKERARAIDSVLVSGNTLLELINDVLDLSKLEAGKMEITPEPSDARLLVMDIASAFQASIVGKELEVRALAQPMPWLRFDPHRVRQILFNLVGNAVKFTEKGFVEIKVEYERTSDGDGEPRGTLYFEVQDTGCGISEEDQRRIDQPYVQVGSNDNRHKGTGLGLAICKQLVARMGGEMRLESELGRGTVFQVVLPNVEEEDTARRARLTATQRIHFAVKAGRTRKFANVLVVDDQTMNRMVLKNMLSRFGVGTVTMAENGLDALAKLREGQFDLVLTDMWMPELDGTGLVREIRRNPAWAQLAVYAITADVEARKSAAELGFTGILLKPVTIEKLNEVFEG